VPLLPLLWPLVLPRGAVDVAVTVEANLAALHQWHPVSIAPDAYWGVTDELTLGVITSARALPRIQVGDGLCFHEGCTRLYDNVGVDARYAVKRGALEVAARTRLVARSFSPFKPSLRPGALVRWSRAWFAVEADPQLWIGLDHRGAGNGDQLSVPVTLRFDLACRGEAWLFTGVRGELSGFADEYAIPVGVGGAVRVRGWDVGGEVGFPELAGPQNQASSRSAYVFVERRVR
jgi:hypothetical protein